MLKIGGGYIKIKHFYNILRLYGIATGSWRL